MGATLIANGTNYTTTTLIYTSELHNLDTGARFYVARHDSSTYILPSAVPAESS